MTGIYTAQLLQRAVAAGYSDASVEAHALVGAALDVGIVTVGEARQLVQSCRTRAELDCKLMALAADVALASGAWEGGK